MSPFVLRLPLSQRHTGFWLLKPVGFCQAPPHRRARRGPSRPASSWACPVYEAVVRGCQGNAGSVPRSEPTDSGPFPRSLGTAAAAASCLGRPLGWKPSDVCVCKHPELTRLWLVPSSCGRDLLPGLWGGAENPGSAAGPSAAALTSPWGCSTPARPDRLGVYRDDDTAFASCRETGRAGELGKSSLDEGTEAPCLS